MSAAIPSGMLAKLRTAFNTSLPRTCTVSTPGASSTDEYGNTTTSATTQTNVKCSFMAATGRERMLGGAVAQIGNYIVTIEESVLVYAKDTVTVNASGSEPQRVFQMVAPLDEPQMMGRRWLATEG